MKGKVGLRRVRGREKWGKNKEEGRGIRGEVGADFSSSAGEAPSLSVTCEGG